MLIDQAYRRGVGYVMMDTSKECAPPERRPAGTAFFIRRETAPGLWLTYAVTARHVIKAGEAMGAVGLYLRVADPPGYRDLRLTVADWEFHPDTDVAVAQVFDPPELDLHSFPFETLATPEFLNKNSVGEGDDIFIVGLFSRFPGNEQIRPIVRFGNIALMPYEPVLAELAKDAPPKPIDAYLVEVRSWGGHSGSPVWGYFPMTRHSSQQAQWKHLKTIEPKLLGLVQGHYPINPDEGFIGDLDGTKQSLAANAGIAIVVPAEKIAETMNEKLKERDETRREEDEDR